MLKLSFWFLTLVTYKISLQDWWAVLLWNIDRLMFFCDLVVSLMQRWLIPCEFDAGDGDKDEDQQGDSFSSTGKYIKLVFWFFWHGQNAILIPFLFRCVYLRDFSLISLRLLLSIEISFLRSLKRIGVDCGAAIWVHAQPGWQRSLQWTEVDTTTEASTKPVASWQPRLNLGLQPRP